MVRWGHEKFSPLASTATSQHGVLTYEQLRAHGLRPHQISYRLKNGTLVRRPGRVFLVAGSAQTLWQEIAAAAHAAALHTRIESGPIGAASHLSASTLFGFRSVDDDVQVSVRHPRKLTLPAAKVVRSRDLLERDLTWVNGIPTTTPERTICDLGLVLPEHEVMRILRHAIATGLVNRCDLARLRWRIGVQGRDGAGIVGRCLERLPDLAELTESGIEVLFLEMVDAFDLPKPVMQLPVVANDQHYRLDFAYPAARVFVEIDGRGHGAPRQISHDGGRQNDLVAHGWQPIRFGYEMLRNDPAYCANVVRTVLDECTSSPDRELSSVPPHGQ